MEDFFNSKTILTPGIAGGLTTLTTGVVSSQFNLPGKWIALLISFLLAIVIFYLDQHTLKIPLKVIFVILNTLIVFAVAVGANTAGAAATAPTRPAFELEQVEAGQKRFFNDWFS
jgi:MFS superfamily sulfate permease-like transporter